MRKGILTIAIVALVVMVAPAALSASEAGTKFERAGPGFETLIPTLHIDNVDVVFDVANLMNDFVDTYAVVMSQRRQYEVPPLHLMPMRSSPVREFKEDFNQKIPSIAVVTSAEMFLCVDSSDCMSRLGNQYALTIWGPTKAFAFVEPPMKNVVLFMWAPEQVAIEVWFGPANVAMGVTKRKLVTSENPKVLPEAETWIPTPLDLALSVGP